MLKSIPILLIIAMMAFSCTENEGKQIDQMVPSIDEPREIIQTDTVSTSDLKEITQLIRDVYVWHDQGNPASIEMILDSVENAYVGYNLVKLDLASKELASSNYFTSNFIQNHKNIHLSAHEKLQSGEIEWKLASLPNFGSGAEPWCNCQDVPYDDPNPWSEIELETINLTDNSGEFYWKWANVDSDWGQFKYYFKVKKVDQEWKVDYLEGLDNKKFSRKYN